MAHCRHGSSACKQVYGSLKLFDIYYQTLAATSLLMSIGISVEFVAHPIAAYEFATGSRDQRLATAMSMTVRYTVRRSIVPDVPPTSSCCV